MKNNLIFVGNDFQKYFLEQLDEINNILTP